MPAGTHFSAANPTKYAEVSLSSAEILALNDTPKELIPAPGAGKAIVPIQVIATFAFGTVAYETYPNTVIIQYGDPGMVDLISYVGLINETDDKVNLTAVTGIQNGRALIENQSVTVFAFFENPTVGDGTLTFGIVYRIVDLP